MVIDFVLVICLKYEYEYCSAHHRIWFQKSAEFHGECCQLELTPVSLTYEHDLTSPRSVHVFELGINHVLDHYLR